MERKKTLRKMAIIAGILAILSAATLLFESVYIQKKERDKVYQKNRQITELTDYYQKYLDKIAGRVTDLKISPEVVSQIKSEILRQMSQTKLYLWMSDTNGEFVFGSPSPVFTRLNKVYNKYKNIFEKDGYFVNRNEFLAKLVFKHDEINFSKFNFSKESKTINRWRLFREDLVLISNSRSIRLSLSTPIFDPDNQILGDLHLNVDHTHTRKAEDIFEGSFFEGFFEFSHIVFGFSLFFLWVLIPSWVYIDARQRDVKDAPKWAFLTVISFGVAAVVYLIVRPAGLKSFYCPECEKELNGTKAFCPYCGFDLSSTFCPQCQYPIKPEWQFCPNCRFDTQQKPKEKTPDKTKKE